jgi:hypothetical protein
MENHRVAAVGADQSIFPAPAEPSDASIRQTLPQSRREGSPQIGAARLDSSQLAPEKHFLEATHGGFNFRKLWHSGDMANVAAPS